MEDAKAKTVLQSCGLSAQLGGGLFLLAGVAGFAVRWGTGKWPAFLEHDLSPPVSAVLLAFVTVYGFLGALLGQRMKKGSTQAIRAFSLVTWAMFAANMVHLVLMWRGWYETLLCAFLAGDCIVAAAYGWTPPSRAQGN